MHVYDSRAPYIIENFISVFEGNATEVKAKWVEILKAALAYNYTERADPKTGKFDGTFKQWPNSKYGLPTDPPFNNSNTFVKELLRNVQIPMKELDGRYPGLDSPKQVPDV